LRAQRLRAGPVGQRVASRPHAWLALALLALEATLAAAGEPSAGLAAVALIVVPGLALSELAPARLRARPLGLAAAVPALGFAASSVVLISMARVGIPIEAWTSRGALAAIVAVGLVLPSTRPPVRRVLPWEAAGLGLAVAAGVVLQSRVLSGTPVPGNDWAKYVLYADEIRRQGSLLIDNPFWMLGVPFREDPGVPAVYGAFLTMAREQAGVLAHAIWVFAVMGILSVFAYVRAVWGPAAAVVAALLLAVLPIQQDILGWHGLANVAALALLPLVLLYATVLVSDRLSWREACGLGLLAVALAATHRLSLSIGAAALVLGVLVGLASRSHRRRTVRNAMRAGAATLAICPLVASDLVIRGRTFGGTQSYETYLASKIDLGLVARDLTWPFVAAGGIAVLVALWRARRDPGVRILFGVLALVAALAYAWVVHLPLAYLRMAYYLPIVLVPLVAVASLSLVRPARTLAAGLALAATVGAIAWGQAANVKRFYAFANPASLRGLDALASRLAPGEVVATDRCWSFLATWLLHTRTLPALDPQDIQPKAELTLARRAHAVLDGTAAGRREARALGIRFLLTDPTCTDARGRPLSPPRVGTPVYVSDRLVVLRLERAS
jgi:hypothetical protein